MKKALMTFLSERLNFFTVFDVEDFFRGTAVNSRITNQLTKE